ncbi:MAG: hypothetical protein ACTHOD_14250 [Motilibacteraceae bacterium]
MLIALGLLTVPWIAYLWATLPQHADAQHYRLGWTGFDVALVLGLARTGQLLWRGRTRVELPAVMTATLLVVDAWFDVTTSPTRRDELFALATAALVELPLAALLAWIAAHAEQVRAVRTEALRRRAVAVQAAAAQPSSRKPTSEA